MRLLFEAPWPASPSMLVAAAVALAAEALAAVAARKRLGPLTRSCHAAQQQAAQHAASISASLVVSHIRSHYPRTLRTVHFLGVQVLFGCSHGCAKEGRVWIEGPDGTPHLVAAHHHQTAADEMD